MTDFYIRIGLPAAMIVLAMFTGTYLERKRLVSIRAREESMKGLPVISAQFFDTHRPVATTKMVMGSAVISIDYFKRFLAGLRFIFGGRVRAYESLVDHARREATLRMMAQFPTADIIVNFRLETSSISQGQNKNSLGSVEALAYGTAIKYEDAFELV